MHQRITTSKLTKSSDAGTWWATSVNGIAPHSRTNGRRILIGKYIVRLP